MQRIIGAKHRTAADAGDAVAPSVTPVASRPVSGAAKAVSSGVSPEVRHLRVDEEFEGQRLDNFLIRHLKGVPKTHVYRVIRSGEVRVNKGRAQADTRLSAGDDVRVPPVRVASASATPRPRHGSSRSCSRTTTSSCSTSLRAWRCMAAAV